MKESIEARINHIDNILFNLKNKLIGDKEQGAHYAMLAKVCSREAKHNKQAIGKFTALRKQLKKTLKNTK